MFFLDTVHNTVIKQNKKQIFDSFFVNYNLDWNNNIDNKQLQK